MTSVSRPHSRVVLARIATENIDFFSRALANSNPVGQALTASMANTLLYTPQPAKSQSTIADHQVTKTLKLVRKTCS